ncbi:MAG: YdaU family protein [Alphaproteobacteria bacterium]|jgi:uncharacterized protein YdaU (DUF1376 family)|nr:YdaU family protein [Alphaproteobacteria bacterium]
MMTLHWYPKYPGDYARDTAHLSMLEHGAYNLLIDYYYSTGQPLPANADANAPALALAKNYRLYRICRAITQEEQKAVDSVIEGFFELQDGFYHHRRIDQELEKRREISDKRSAANAKMRESKSKKANKKPANNQQMHQHLQEQMHSTTTTTTTDSISNDIESHMAAVSSISVLEIDMLFQGIWNEYPSQGKNGARGNGFKGSKQRALKAFTNIIKNERTENHETLVGTIRTAIGQYQKFLDRSGYPCKHASTWLNERGWEDDYSGTTGQPSGQKFASKHERARNILAGDDPSFIEG